MHQKRCILISDFCKTLTILYSVDWVYNKIAWKFRCFFGNSIKNSWVILEPSKIFQFLLFFTIIFGLTRTRGCLKYMVWDIYQHFSFIIEVSLLFTSQYQLHALSHLTLFLSVLSKKIQQALLHWQGKRECVPKGHAALV